MRLIFIILFTSTILLACSENKTDQGQESNNAQKQNTMSQETNNSETVFTATDYKLFKQCLDLAQQALDAGDQPFGSILVNADNEIIAKARNRINEKNVLAHPEIELAEWAINNLSFEERRETKMYTTGEHCPMCAGAHAWSQIGELYYLSSAKQLGQWLNELGVSPAPIEFIPSEKIMKNVKVKGPVKGEMLEEIKKMHEKYYQQ